MQAELDCMPFCYNAVRKMSMSEGWATMNGCVHLGWKRSVGVIEQTIRKQISYDFPLRGKVEAQERVRWIGVCVYCLRKFSIEEAWDQTCLILCGHYHCAVSLVMIVHLMLRAKDPWCQEWHGHWWRREWEAQGHVSVKDKGNVNAEGGHEKL